jgi:hypothetical protein
MSETVCVISDFGTSRPSCCRETLSRRGSGPVLLSLLDVPTDDLRWLTLDPPPARPAHAGPYRALKKAISAD